MSTTNNDKKSQTEILEQLRNGLTDLRLHEMREQLDREVDSDDEAVSWLQRLHRLVQAQQIGRRERGIARRLKQAGFPASKTLDGFDFVFQTGVDRNQIMSLATLDWLKTNKSLLIAGMSGTGKSHIAIALGHLACVHGFRVRYVTSAQLLTKLHGALATDDLQQALKPFVRCDLLIIDEVGLDRPERQTYKTDDAGLFYKVVAARYEAGRSCVITTNIPWDAWGQYLGDDIATTAILDRLIHRSYTITIEGPSYRAAEHQRLNQSSHNEEQVGD
jgi:DNA replication protein DnaC